MRIRIKRRPKAYYNENDLFAAAWLKCLIQKQLIAYGDVDDRSIEEVKPSEIENYTQAHFFAGIGVWSYALRSAGWKDEWPVWTGSCPCQPFSCAGKGEGFADKRHLWPCWFKLIEKCAPVTVFGEQVASKDGLAWFDLVQTDLERANYTVGAVDTCAAGFGAPHQRQRLYFVAESEQSGARRNAGTALGTETSLRRPGHSNGMHGGDASFSSGATGLLAQSRQQPAGRGLCGPAEGHTANGSGAPGQPERNGSPGELDHSERGKEHAATARGLHAMPSSSGPTNGFWRDAEWIPCRNPKIPGAVDWRAIKPGTFPLAHGAPARVGRLRGYGNAIVAEQAKAFVEAYMDIAK